MIDNTGILPLPGPIINDDLNVDNRANYDEAVKMVKSIDDTFLEFYYNRTKDYINKVESMSNNEKLGLMRYIGFTDVTDNTSDEDIFDFLLMYQSLYFYLPDTGVHPIVKSNIWNASKKNLIKYLGISKGKGAKMTRNELRISAIASRLVTI